MTTTKSGYGLNYRCLVRPNRRIVALRARCARASPQDLETMAREGQATGGPQGPIPLRSTHQLLVEKEWGLGGGIYRHGLAGLGSVCATWTGTHKYALFPPIPPRQN